MSSHWSDSEAEHQTEGGEGVLRVMIADDEARICKLIRLLADWEKLRMEVVGIASDGLQALEMTRAFSPDILITDIRMPGLDGLSLIREAKAALPGLEVIIISGYAQFDYAQTALQHGVGDYLLKPINREALNGTLEKIGERCRARHRDARDVALLRESSRSDSERIRQSLLPDLLENRCVARDAETFAKAYRFAADGERYQAFLLKMDYAVDSFPERSLAVVRDKARELLAAALCDLCGDFVLHSAQSGIYGMMSYAAKRQNALRLRLRECLNQLVEMRSLFGAVVFTLALGEAVHAVLELAASLGSARRIISERLTEGSARLLESVGKPSALAEADLRGSYMRAIAPAIEALDPAAADDAAEALRQAACAVPGVLGGELLELVQSAGAFFINRAGVEGHEAPLAAFQRRCEQCDTQAALFACLAALQRDLLRAALEKRRDRDGQPIRVAKQYIHRNFAKALTLEEVSAASGFSVNYFSTLFKKETGDGFVKYLTRVRVEEAKNLLRETRLSVPAVCERVGYGDVKHFTHTFRAETGLTPGEFRKLYG